MKYIVDIDALKDCLELLPTSYSDAECVYLSDVEEMIDRFPKEEYKKEYEESVYNTTCSSVNEDIKNGKGLKPLT